MVAILDFIALGWNNRKFFFEGLSEVHVIIVKRKCVLKYDYSSRGCSAFYHFNEYPDFIPSGTTVDPGSIVLVKMLGEKKVDAFVTYFHSFGENLPTISV